jgi:hypothetical protein
MYCRQDSVETEDGREGHQLLPETYTGDNRFVKAGGFEAKSVG